MHEEVFPRLVEAHYSALYRFALSLTRRTADAGDLTQQTFFLWARKGSSLRDRSKAKAWLFTTLYREFLRTRRREARVSALEDLSPPEQDPPDENVERLDRLDAETVLQALQEVEAVFREPLALFYLQEFSYQEIAEILDVPIGTVMSRLSRGKAQLRARLAEKPREGTVIKFPPLRAHP